MNTNRPTAAQQKESDETALAVWQAAATAPSNKSALRRYTMRNKFMVIGLIGIVIGVLLSTAVVLAGSLNPSVGPTGAASQMFTLQQIYDRLTSGAAGTKMTTFTEPGSGPGTSTMRTLDEIMAQAPAADNTNGPRPARGKHLTEPYVVVLGHPLLNFLDCHLAVIRPQDVLQHFL